MSRNFFRKPSLKKSISAKYNAQWKRHVKKALIPGYGQKGAGWRNPKRKIYNKYYNKSSFDTRKIVSATVNKHEKEIDRNNVYGSPIINRAVRGLHFDFNLERLNAHEKLSNFTFFLVFLYVITYFVTRVSLFFLIICVIGNAPAPIDFFLWTAFIGFCARWIIRAVVNSVFTTFS